MVLAMECATLADETLLFKSCAKVMLCFAGVGDDIFRNISYTITIVYFYMKGHLHLIGPCTLNLPSPSIPFCNKNCKKSKKKKCKKCNEMSVMLCQILFNPYLN